MVRLLLVMSVLVAVALGNDEVPINKDLFRRFMDSVMGSERGAFGGERDVDLSRAVRDYVGNLRDTDDKLRSSEDDMANKISDLHRRVALFGEDEAARSALDTERALEKLRDQTKRFVDITKRTLDERDDDALSKTVRSIKEYADGSKRAYERALEEENHLKRSLKDLHERMLDIQHDTSDKEARAPMALFGKREEHGDKVARALDSLFKALEE